ncbi:MAG: TraB/GumN family protein [Deltaproteobacteria bacterium]|nr:MAG: TraB/GumN family protein [Deltaproteobacteria bacterium]
MRKIWSVAALVVLSGTVASAGGNPLLWELRVKGQLRGYLFGTIHLPDERLKRLHPLVEQAYSRSTVLVTEVPLDLGSQMKMVARSTLQGGKTLDDLLPEKLASELKSLFSGAGLPWAVISRMKIWAVAIQVALVDHIMEMARNPGLDQVLYNRAKADGKALEALETIDEQVDIFDGLDRTEQVELLKSSLKYYRKKKKKGIDPVRELLDVYLSGDPAAIRKKIEEEYGESGKLERRLMDKLFHERNGRMARRIFQRLADRREDGPWFFAIGAGHIPGADGVAQTLSKMGVTVTRATAAAR